MSFSLKSRWRSVLLSGVAGLALTGASLADEATIVVQIDDYQGEEAYFSLYLVNPEGRYEKTLWISGDEKVWWPSTTRWYSYLSRNPQDVDAITGASTAASGRAVIRIDIDPELIDAGYRMRVESSVENQSYHQDDVEVELTRDNVRVKTPGTGYVRYIRYKL